MGCTCSKDNQKSTPLVYKTCSDSPPKQRNSKLPLSIFNQLPDEVDESNPIQRALTKAYFKYLDRKDSSMRRKREKFDESTKSLDYFKNQRRHSIHEDRIVLKTTGIFKNRNSILKLSFSMHGYMYYKSLLNQFSK